jgi:hypothetical protein
MNKILWFFILTQVFCVYSEEICEYEKNFNFINKVETIEKETVPGYFFSSVEYYVNCSLKTNVARKFKICPSCYERISNDNKFFQNIKKCNFINVDRSFQLFFMQDPATKINMIAILECKDHFYLPVYYSEQFFVVTLETFGSIESKLVLDFNIKMNLFPYSRLKNIIGYHFYKADNCSIIFSLSDFAEREYSKNSAQAYDHSFADLYFGDHKAIENNQISDSSEDRASEDANGSIQKIFDQI